MVYKAGFFWYNRAELKGKRKVTLALKKAL
jgi:hypothetical protein